MDPPWNQETPEHINYTKLCRLVYDGGTLALKTVFDTKCPPASLATTLAKNRPALLKFRGRGLYQDQWDLLYPPSGASPKSEDFDITLLSFLLRNICSLSVPVRSETDNIRKCRNKITAHRPEAKVNQSDFEFYWNEISSALVSLGLNQDDIDKLKSSPLGVENYNRLMENWESCDREIERQLELMNRNLAEMKTDLVEMKTNQAEMKTNQAEMKTNQAEIKTEQAEMKTDLVEIKSVVHDIHSKMPNTQHIESNLAHIDYTALREKNCNIHHPSTRQWIFNKVEEDMKQVKTGASVVVIRAGPGMGKSIVAAKICEIYQTKGLLGGCHFFQYNDSNRNNPRLMLQSIASQLCNTLPCYQAALETKLKTLQGKHIADQNSEELFGILFEEPFSQIKIDHNVVIVIDALDECASQFKKELEDAFNKKLFLLPSWIRFVITTRPLPSFDNLSSTVEIKIGPSDSINTQDINTFLAFELEKRSADQSLIDKLMEISQGLFLVAYFILEILDQSEDQSLPNVIKHLPHGITSVYEYYFRRIRDLIKPYLDSSQSEDSFYKMLDAVVASENPIPKEMFYEILCLKSVDEVGREKRKDRNDAVHLLHTIFPVENDHVTVFHKTVIDWLKDDASKNPEFSVSVSRGVKLFAEKSFNDLKGFKERQIPLDQPLEYSDCEMFLFKYGIDYIMDSSQFSDSQKEGIRNDIRVLAVTFNIYEPSLSYPSWLYQLGDVFISMIQYLIGFPLLFAAKKSFGYYLSIVGTALLSYEDSPLSSAEKLKLCQFLDQKNLPYYLLSTHECFDLPQDFHDDLRVPSLNVFEVTNGFIVCTAKNDDNGCLEHYIVCCLVKEGGIVRAEPFMKTFDRSHVVRGVSPDKKHLIVTTTRKIELYDVPTLEKLDLDYDWPVDHVDSLHIFGGAEQWYIVVSAEHDRNIYILNGFNGQRINTINVDKPFLKRKHIVTVSQNGDIAIVNVLHDSDYSNEDDDDDYSHDYDWAIVINDSLYKVEIYSVHFKEKDTKNAIIYKTGSPIKKEIGYCSFLNTETPLNVILEKCLDFKFSDDGKYLAFLFMESVYVLCTRNESECKTIDLDVRPLIKKNTIISVSQSQLITSNVNALLLFSLDDGQEKAIFAIEYEFDINSFNPTDNFNSMPSCWLSTKDKLLKMDFHNL